MRRFEQWLWWALIGIIVVLAFTADRLALTLLISACVAGIAFVLLHWRRASSNDSPTTEASAADTAEDAQSQAAEALAADNETVEVATIAAPRSADDARWIAPGQSVRIASTDIPGGMFYFGAQLPLPNGETAPCLIDESLPVTVASPADQAGMANPPSYGKASPASRRVYLDWLAGGRAHPDCAIEYVFLFFYGLERRIVVDAQADPTAGPDLPAIASELRRLLEIYGASNIFRACANGLLDWIALSETSGKLYDQPLPPLEPGDELPFYLRLALGQAAMDGVPIATPLALAWLQLSPQISLPTVAHQCPEEFARLFEQRYRERFGPGLVLRSNRTRLRCTYRPANATLRDLCVARDLGDVPDVTATTRPLHQLAELAYACAEPLDAYRRLLQQVPTLAGSLAGLVTLPPAVWPETTHERVHALAERVVQTSLVLTPRELAGTLAEDAETPAVPRERLRTLALALQDAHVGMEPDILRGARLPADNDKLVLFVQPSADAPAKPGTTFLLARLALQLSAARSESAGANGGQEIRQLHNKVGTWPDLIPADRGRLHAHVQWLVANPPSIAHMQRKLAPLDRSTRRDMARGLLRLCSMPAHVEAEEVRFLQGLFKTLEVELGRILVDFGAPTEHGVPANGFDLDPVRRAAWQQLPTSTIEQLHKLYVEEPIPEPATTTPETMPAQPPLLPGLDPNQSALARLLLSRPRWKRAEAQDAATDLNLSLEAALPAINAAAQAAFQLPLCEGEDPLLVHTDLTRRLHA